MEVGDAFGREVLDYLEHGVAQEIVERDDGYITTSAGAAAYFRAPRTWPPPERATLRYVRGRVLDVGAGAGRSALHLQERGHEVVAIDVSPGAVEVCRRRGVRDARAVSVDDIDAALGIFDTVLMLGNNFGLLQSRTKARRLPRTFHALTTDRGRVVATNVDPSTTDDPDHLAYHERNRRRGRLPGQLRIRVRYKQLASPWFDYLLAEPDELDELVAGSGWHVHRLVHAHETALYGIVLEKD